MKKGCDSHHVITVERAVIWERIQMAVPLLGLTLGVTDRVSFL